MKDILKLFETIMDFKGLSFLVTEQSLMKKQRPFFLLPLLTSQIHNAISSQYNKVPRIVALLLD